MTLYIFWLCMYVCVFLTSKLLQILKLLFILRGSTWCNLSSSFLTLSNVMKYLIPLSRHVLAWSGIVGEKHILIYMHYLLYKHIHTSLQEIIFPICFNHPSDTYNLTWQEGNENCYLTDTYREQNWEAGRMQLDAMLNQTEFRSSIWVDELKSCDCQANVVQLIFFNYFLFAAF